MSTVLGIAAMAGIAFVTARFFYELFNAFYCLILTGLTKIRLRKPTLPSKMATAKVILGASVGTWILFLLFFPAIFTVAIL